MANEFDDVLDGVDLGNEALDADELTEDVGASNSETTETVKEEADQQVAETDDEPEKGAQDSDEAASPTRPAKGVGKQKSDSVPLPKFMAERRENRELKLRLAQYEAERAVPAPQPVKEAGKSPMEQFIEKEGEDAVPPAKVFRDQKQWERDQSQSQQRAVVENIASRAVNVAVRAMTDDVMGAGLGFDTVLAFGHNLLDEYDQAAIRAAGPKAGELMYDLLRSRLVKSNTPQGKMIRMAIRQAHTSSTPKNNPTGQGKPKPVQQDGAAPSREEVLDETGADDMVEFLS